MSSSSESWSYFCTAFLRLRCPRFGGGQPLISQLTQHIHLGLDLQGGAHLILQVEVKEAVSTETDNTVARIEQDLKTAKLTFSQVTSRIRRTIRR